MNETRPTKHIDQFPLTRRLLGGNEVNPATLNTESKTNNEPISQSPRAEVSSVPQLTCTNCGYLYPENISGACPNCQTENVFNINPFQVEKPATETVVSACMNCGAPLVDAKCSVCGTEYAKIPDYKIRTSQEVLGMSPDDLYQKIIGLMKENKLKVELSDTHVRYLTGIIHNILTPLMEENGFINEEKLAALYDGWLVPQDRTQRLMVQRGLERKLEQVVPEFTISHKYIATNLVERLKHKTESLYQLVIMASTYFDATDTTWLQSDALLQIKKLVVDDQTTDNNPATQDTKLVAFQQQLIAAGDSRIKSDPTGDIVRQRELHVSACPQCGSSRGESSICSYCNYDYSNYQVTHQATQEIPPHLYALDLTSINKHFSGENSLKFIDDMLNNSNGKFRDIFSYANDLTNYLIRGLSHSERLDFLKQWGLTDQTGNIDLAGSDNTFSVMFKNYIETYATPTQMMFIVGQMAVQSFGVEVNNKPLMLIYTFVRKHYGKDIPEEEKQRVSQELALSLQEYTPDKQSFYDKFRLVLPETKSIEDYMQSLIDQYLPPDSHPNFSFSSTREEFNAVVDMVLEDLKKFGRDRFAISQYLERALGISTNLLRQVNPQIDTNDRTYTQQLINNYDTYSSTVKEKAVLISRLQNHQQLETNPQLARLNLLRKVALKEKVLNPHEARQLFSGKMTVAEAQAILDGTFKESDASPAPTQAPTPELSPNPTAVTQRPAEALLSNPHQKNDSSLWTNIQKLWKKD